MPTSLKDTLLATILPLVESPGQYVGGEWNAVVKDWDAADVRVALCFPDTYAVGMSHVGLKILYYVLNEMPGVLAERAFAPMVDMEQCLRAAGLRAFSLENHRPLCEFDVVGFSLQYELCSTNVLTMLGVGGIPLHREERGDGDPIVVAGANGALVPESMSDFIDIFFTGDGEETVQRFAELVRRLKVEGAGREAILEATVRELPCAYAPALYEARWGEDGAYAGLAPRHPWVPATVAAAYVADLDAAPFPTKPVVPYVETVHDRISLEIMRGCPRNCRFCQASAVRGRPRTRSVETLVRLAEETYRNTGYSEASLLSLSSADYPKFGELITAMTARLADRNVNVSLPSLHAGKHLTELPAVLNRVRKSGLTIAPEAATERLRGIIGKRVREEDVYEGARAAFEAGWQSLKLYFMVGLPGERDEDVDAIARMCGEVVSIMRSARKGRGKGIAVTIAPFVPKPHTPFQWFGMADLARLEEIRQRIRSGVNRRRVRVKFNDPCRGLLEGALARGDRRVGCVIESAWRAGARFDAWEDRVSFDRWRKAFAEAGMDPAEMAQRELPGDRPLPWDHIRAGADPAELRAQFCEIRREITPAGDAS